MDAAQARISEKKVTFASSHSFRHFPSYPFNFLSRVSRILTESTPDMFAFSAAAGFWRCTSFYVLWFWIYRNSSDLVALLNRFPIARRSDVMFQFRQIFLRRAILCGIWWGFLDFHNIATSNKRTCKSTHYATSNVRRNVLRRVWFPFLRLTITVSTSTGAESIITTRKE